jgi:hypothetical protein
MDDFGKDVGKSWRLSRLIPAYRATLLSFRRGGTKSPLTFLIYLKQFVTLPIASFPKFTGRKIGQSGRKTGRN